MIRRFFQAFENKLSLWNHLKFSVFLTFANGRIRVRWTNIPGLTNITNINIAIFKKEQKQAPEVFYEKGVFKNFPNFTGKHPCWSLFLIKLQALDLQLYLKETPTKVFSCEICKIFEMPSYASSIHYGDIETFCPMGHILVWVLKHFAPWYIFWSGGIETFCLLGVLKHFETKIYKIAIPPCSILPTHSFTIPQ